MPVIQKVNNKINFVELIAVTFCCPIVSLFINNLLLSDSVPFYNCGSLSIQKGLDLLRAPF